MERLNLAVLLDPGSSLSETYRTICANLQFMCSKKDIRVIEFTNAVVDPEKSVTVANLAVVMAQSGNKVLLMDCDLQNPVLHTLLGVSDSGVMNFIAAGGAYRDYIQHTGQENLDILASGISQAAVSQGILMGNRIKELLVSAREDYDYVLVDSPSIMQSADAVALGSKADGVLLLVAGKKEKAQDAVEAKKRLEQAGANVIGCILNINSKGCV